jgi:hypothetical protein
LAAASSAPAQAATSCDRVASPSGSDSGAGTLESPYLTASKLAGSLAPGETGCFRAGTYSFGTLTLTTAQVTLAPYGSEAVTLAGHLKIMPGAANSVIEGMTLDASSSPDNTMGPKIYASGVVLRDNEITNRHSEICVIVGSYYSEPAPVGVVIERNRIHDCGALPATNLDHGIYIAEARSTIVRDNWIYDNADRGIQQYPDVKGSVITGNVIASNGQGVNFSGAGSLVTTDATVAGNVVVDSKIGDNAYSGGSGPNGTNNLFRDNCVHSLSGGSGIESSPRSFTASNNLVANPDFVAAAADDYRLQASSACLAKYTGTMSGAGSDATAMVPETSTAGASSAEGQTTVSPPDTDPKSGRVKLAVNRRSVRRGRQIRLRGNVPVGLESSHRRVVIERRKGGEWRRAAGTPVRSNQRFSASVSASNSPVLKLRAVVARAAHSRVIRVRVRG